MNELKNKVLSPDISILNIFILLGCHLGLYEPLMDLMVVTEASGSCIYFTKFLIS